MKESDLSSSEKTSRIACNSSGPQRLVLRNQSNFGTPDPRTSDLKSSFVEHQCVTDSFRPEYLKLKRNSCLSQIQSTPKLSKSLQRNRFNVGTAIATNVIIDNKASLPKTSEHDPIPKNIVTEAILTPKLPAVRVMITYVQEFQSPKKYAAQLNNIANTLMKNNIEVVFDKREQRKRDASMAEWLDWNLEKSNFVLVCISPSYLKVVSSRCLEKSLTFSEKDEVHQAKYVYRRLQTEYIRAGSKNYRLLPILLSGTVEQHIPRWLLDTMIYEWPRNYKEIICRLYGVEPYLATEPGPIPVPVVHYYRT